MWCVIELPWCTSTEKKVDPAEVRAGVERRIVEPSFEAWATMMPLLLHPASSPLPKSKMLTHISESQM